MLVAGIIITLASLLGVVIYWDQLTTWAGLSTVGGLTLGLVVITVAAAPLLSRSEPLDVVPVPAVMIDERGAVKSRTATSATSDSSDSPDNSDSTSGPAQARSQSPRKPQARRSDARAQHSARLALRGYLAGARSIDTAVAACLSASYPEGQRSCSAQAVTGLDRYTARAARQLAAASRQARSRDCAQVIRQLRQSLPQDASVLAGSGDPVSTTRAELSGQRSQAAERFSALSPSC